MRHMYMKVYVYDNVNVKVGIAVGMCAYIRSLLIREHSFSRSTYSAATFLQRYL